MSKFATEKSIWRYSMVASICTLIAFAVVARGFIIMTVERNYWMTVDSLRMPKGGSVPPQRGNILAAGGERLACNLPEYELRMDFVALQSGKADSMWHDKKGNDAPQLIQLCEGLHEIFPEKTAEEFMKHLKLAIIATHVADAHTCILHPASSTHRQMTDEELIAGGVSPDLIRLSVGIENVDDIIEDIEGALKAL
jgi:cell division protein FtsI/penicillin-binding protein 2